MMESATWQGIEEHPLLATWQKIGATIIVAYKELSVLNNHVKLEEFLPQLSLR